jgi:hypothetical protein
MNHHLNTASDAAAESTSPSAMRESHHAGSSGV